MSEAHAVFELARRLAREAGAIQRERYETGVAIRSKSAPIDLVTEVDHACERHIVSTLAAERPHDAILAEEGGGSDHAGAEWRWIIDPLDGTTNYAHGYPRFCVSIGVEHEDRARVGVVYDPLVDELYCALRGEGLRAAADWIEFYRQFWEQRFDQLGAFLARTAPQAGKRTGKGKRHGRRR